MMVIQKSSGVIIRGSRYCYWVSAPRNHYLYSDGTIHALCIEPYKDGVHGWYETVEDARAAIELYNQLQTKGTTVRTQISLPVLLDKVRQAVKVLTHTGLTFTAYSVTTRLRLDNPTIEISHEAVKGIIEQLYNNDDLGKTYKRESRVVPGTLESAYHYFPVSIATPAQSTQSTVINATFSKIIL